MIPTVSDDAERQSEQRREDDEDADLLQAAGDEDVDPALGDGGAGDAADEGVGRAGGQAEVEGDQVPADGADQPGEHDADRQHVGVDDAGGDGGGDDGAEHQEGDEVEERRPHHRQAGDKTWVETTVAIELAASWNPLTKSNASAIAMTTMTPVSSIRPSRFRRA